MDNGTAESGATDLAKKHPYQHDSTYTCEVALSPGSRIDFEGARYVVLGIRSHSCNHGGGPARTDYELRRIRPLPMRRVYKDRFAVEAGATRVND